MLRLPAFSDYIREVHTGTQGVNAVICSSMGRRAIEKLNEGGVRAYRASGGKAEDIVRQYRTGGVEEITAENACGHHGGHHGCHH